jgi:thermolysin
MKRIVLAAGMTLLSNAACGGSSPSHEEAAAAAPQDATPEQSAAFQRLVAETGARWTFRQHDLLATPAHLEGRTEPLLRGRTAEAATLAFLDAHKALFRMRAPTEELTRTRSRTDALDMTHVRFEQRTHGLRVAGAELMAHYDATGALRVVDANYVSGLEGLDLSPSLTAQAAQDAAFVEFRTRSQSRLGPSVSPTAEATAPELLVYAPGDQPPALAYRFEIADNRFETLARVEYTVNAKTGALLNVMENLQAVTAQGQSSTGKTFSFEATQQGGAYAMIDTTRAAGGIRTYSANGGQGMPGSLVTSTSLTANWDRNGAKPGSAVDAHYYAGKVYDVYKTKLARNGLNGQGGAMVSTVHYGQNFANAFWTGSQMVYGDGTAATASFAAALDVVGHEFTHGVTGSESNLTYQNQSGALNEAMSDIFGNIIEHEVFPDPVKNWQVGEGLLGAQFLRDMQDPSKGRQPGHMAEFVRTSQDNGGVHINSGIVNNAAYLMTMGGTQLRSKVQVARGIGWESLAKVFYRANTEYLLQSSDFKAAANATAKAATDLKLSDNDVKVIDCAWKAVGVLPGACDALAPEASTPDGGASDASAATASGSSSSSGGAFSSSGAPKNEAEEASAESGCSTSDASPTSGLGRGLLATALIAFLFRRRRSGASRESAG